MRYSIMSYDQLWENCGDWHGTCITTFPFEMITVLGMRIRKMEFPIEELTRRFWRQAYRRVRVSERDDMVQDCLMFAWEAWLTHPERDAWKLYWNAWGRWLQRQHDIVMERLTTDIETRVSVSIGLEQHEVLNRLTPRQQSIVVQLIAGREPHEIWSRLYIGKVTYYKDLERIRLALVLGV